MIVGQMKTSGTFSISGEEKNKPVVYDELILDAPMDYGISANSYNNIVDYSTWVDSSSGNQPGWGAYGTSSYIATSPGPFTTELDYVKQWRATRTVDSLDGGFSSGTTPINPTKMYRFTTWVHRDTVGTGIVYFGPYATGTTNGVYIHEDGGALETNPYFSGASETYWGAGQVFENSEWLLLVGFIHPHDSTDYGRHVDSGYYDANSPTKIALINKDFRWHPDSNSAYIRTFLYGSDDDNTMISWVYPRIDIVDGSEPSLMELITSEGNSLYVFPKKTRYIRDHLNGSSANTGNHWVEIEAISYNGTNVALDIQPTGSDSITNPTYLTDGSTDSANYMSIPEGAQWCQIDLGKIYDIQSIKVWHYYTDGRTYYGKKTEVSADGVTWNTLYDDSIDTDYAETSSAKVHGIYDEFASNVGRSPDGAFVQQSVKNYISQGTTGLNANQVPAWITNPADQVTATTYRNGLTTHRFDPNVCMYCYTIDEQLDDDLATLSEEVVTFSVFVRCTSTSTTGQIRIYDDISGYRYQSVDLTNEFQRFEMTATIGLNPTRIFVMVDNTGAVPGEYFEFHSVLLVLGSEPKGYVNGAVGDKGTTLGYKLTNHKYINSAWQDGMGEDASILFDIKATDNIWKTIISNNGSMGTFWGLTTDGDGEIYVSDFTGGTQTNIELPINEWVSIAITISGGFIRIYLNRDLIFAQTHHLQVIHVQSVYLGGAGSPEGGDTPTAMFRNFLFYGKQLSHAEIIKLDNTCASLTSTGDLISTNIQHKCTVPSDGYFSSMEFNGNDITYTNNPSEDNGFYLSKSKAMLLIGGAFEYNMHEAFGWDWSNDWSICYWKKAQGTHDGNYVHTGYNIESLGSSDNTVGDSYLWWGKSDGLMELGHSETTFTNKEFIESDYFNYHQVITLVKNAGTLTINIQLVDGVERMANINLSSLNPNSYSTQHGFDLKFLGWNTTSPCYGSIKNLYVVQRVMTTQELIDFRSPNIKITPEGLQIPNGIYTF